MALKLRRSAARTTPFAYDKDDDDHDQESMSGLSAALSPSSSWRIAMTPTNAMQKQVSIHTGGMDLGALLSQETKVNTSDDHIFADDGSNGSPAASVAISEADLSRVSLLHIQCSEEEKEAEAVLTDEAAFFGSTYDDEHKFDSNDDNEEETIEEWSLHNQQLGREVAKHVLLKARANSASVEQTQPVGNAVFLCTSGDANEKSTVGSSEKKQRVSATTKKQNKDGPILKCIKKLRKKRKAFLQKIFKSRDSSKKTNARSDLILESQTSIDSGSSSRNSSPTMGGLSTETNILSVTAPDNYTPSQQSPDSVYTQATLKSASPTKGQQESISAANRQSSQVVDSILRQFSDLPRNRSNPTLSRQHRPRSSSSSSFFHSRPATVRRQTSAPLSTRDILVAHQQAGEDEEDNIQTIVWNTGSM